MTKLYIHVHVRKAIEGIGFLLSPLRALASVAKRTRTHQKTQFALGDFHSFFPPTDSNRWKKIRSWSSDWMYPFESESEIQKWQSNFILSFQAREQMTSWKSMTQRGDAGGKGVYQSLSSLTESWGVGRGGCDDEGKRSMGEEDIPTNGTFCPLLFYFQNSKEYKQ